MEILGRFSLPADACMREGTNAADPVTQSQTSLPFVFRRVLRSIIFQKLWQKRESEQWI
jgi:hypothetical protein